MGRGASFVGDEHDRLAELVAGAPQLVEDLAAGGVVEVAGRLVGQQDRRPADEGAGQRDSLLLAGGQLVGPVALAAEQVHQLEDLVDARGRVAVARIHAGDGERQRHVLVDVEERDQVEELEDEAGLLAPQAGGLGIAQVADDLAVEHDLAARSAGPARRGAAAACSCPSRTAPSGPRTRRGERCSETPRRASTSRLPSR